MMQQILRIPPKTITVKSLRNIVIYLGAYILVTEKHLYRNWRRITLPKFHSIECQSNPSRVQHSIIITPIMYFNLRLTFLLGSTKGCGCINTLMILEPTGRDVADGTSKSMFLAVIFCILIQISILFVTDEQTENTLTMVEVVARRLKAANHYPYHF